MRPELQDIVDDVSRMLHRPATLEDRNFNLVAFCSHEDGIDEIRQHTILRRHSSAEVRAWFEQFGIATTDRPVRIPSSPENGVLGRLCLPVRWHGVTYGYVWLLDEHNEIDDAALPAVLTLVDRVGALMAQQARVREDLGYRLQDLLSAEPETAEQAADVIHDQRIIRRGVPVAAVVVRQSVPASGLPEPINLGGLPRSVLISVAEDATTLLVPLAAAKTTGTPGASTASAPTATAADTDLTPAKEMARRVRDLCAKQLDTAAQADLVAGIGAPRADLAQARGSWHEARLATRVSQAVPQLRPVAAWPELGVYRLLACGSEAALAGAVLDPAVMRLLEHGDQDLNATAAAYLDHGGNVQQTAATLDVHRQTVYYRLERIEKVTGLDLSRGDQRLLLHLGLTMAPLLAGPTVTRASSP
jgi:hypothetical protein